MINKILVPLDGSEAAEAVLPEIASLAEKFQSEIILMKVVAGRPAQSLNQVPFMTGPGMTMVKMIPSVFPVTLNTPNVLADDIMLQDAAGANEYLSEIARSLAAQGLKVSTVTRTGKRAEAILNLASDRDVDLIVMSTRARSQASKTVRGSVPEQVLRESKVPVIFVKPTPAALAKAKLLRYPVAMAS